MPLFEIGLLILCNDYWGEYERLDSITRALYA
jgi:hypothetical protein